jgi:hypothetical protein
MAQESASSKAFVEAMQVLRIALEDSKGRLSVLNDLAMDLLESGRAPQKAAGRALHWALEEQGAVAP